MPISLLTDPLRVTTSKITGIRTLTVGFFMPAQKHRTENDNMIDTHCHLDFPQYQGDIGAVIQRAVNAGIDRMITVGTDPVSSAKCVELAREHEAVFAAVGIHPNSTVGVSDADWVEIRRLAREPKVLAVGETGLDYYRDTAPPDAQKDYFRRHIELSRETGLPLIVHCREAYDDCYEILAALERPVHGVMHCFSGSKADAARFAELGMYISFAGPVTFPKAESLREVALSVPPEILLVETDAPFLAPQQHRGKRNEPAFARYTAAAIAQMHSMSLAEIDRVTTQNAVDLFGFERRR